MTSIKCSQCGLVNWSTSEACKRCGELLPAAAGDDQFGAHEGAYYRQRRTQQFEPAKD